MNIFLWILWVAVVIAITVWALGGAKRRRRNALRVAAAEGGLSEDDREMIAQNVVQLQTMPDELKSRMEPIILVLFAEKNFESCGDLEEVTREMKLTILAQAAFLLVGRRHNFYPRLRSILVYPDAYRGRDPDGEEEDGGRLGESWDSGSVVLSWKSVLKGGENDGDGRNVVLHEFAHQLDQENRRADGLPVLENRSAIGKWAHAFSGAYDAFCEDLDAGRKTVMDPYGATNPAEFFAVATETFFEKAEQLHEEAPALFEQLKNYYGLDPRSWDAHD